MALKMRRPAEDSETKRWFPRSRYQTYAPWILPVGVVLAFAPWLIRVLGPYWGLAFHVSPLQLLILGSTGLGALWLGLRGRVAYVSMVAFPILFLVGYPLRIISIEMNSSVDTLGDVSLYIGRFSFTNEAYWEFTMVAALGLIGLAFGQVLVRAWCRSKELPRTGKVSWSSTKMFSAVGWWFGMSVGAVLLSAVLGVGSSGLEHSALPFRITGLLFFSRTLALPLVGMYLFGVAVEHNMRRQAYAILLLSVIIGVASFPVTLSKASLLYAVLPYLAYLSICSYHSRLSKRMVRSGVVAVVLLLPVAVLSVQAARDFAYSKGRLGSPKEIVEEFSANFGSVSATDSVVALRDLVLDRILGSSELMGVIAGHPYRRGLIFEVLRGNGTIETVRLSDVFYDLFGLSPSTVDGVYNGKAFGLFGLLYLSHELFLVFLLALVLGGLVLWVENIFLRNINAGAAALVSFMISMAVWEGGFDTLRLYPVVLGGILVACWISSTKAKRKESITLGLKMPVES